MCGVAGIFGYADAEVSSEVIGRMLSLIRHRGPDDEGSWVEPHVAIGNRRLSIIDIAGGHQPMTNEDGSVVVVFNGEIYNYKELAARLRRSGHHLRSASDTEVIVHLYEDRGDDLVQDLRGMFSFAIWDRRRRRLLLARDRLGIKPLYYADLGDRLVFGSEIKSLLQDAGLPVRLDLRALALHLTLKYVPAPGTLFHGINALEPGHLLTCDRSGVDVRQWWTLSFAEDPNVPVDEDAAADRLRQLLRNSVEAHLVSDVPFGAFLSGGLDSSTVVALMSQSLSTAVKTFSVGYDGDAESMSELPYARLVADRYDTDHHEIVVRASDFVALSERVAWHLDQPIADEACLPTYLLSELASRQVKMVLTGEGGDELFAGYARHSGERFSSVARSIPGPIKAAVLRGSEMVPRLRRAKQALFALSEPDEARRFVNWFCLFNDTRLNGLLSDSVQRELGGASASDTFAARLSASDARNSLSRMLHIDTTLWLPDDLLARGDKMSMAASVEARLPLLDHHLVEFAAGLSPHLKLRGRTRKYLLRKAVAGWLPAPVLSRKKKGFPTPTSMWFRGEARPFLYDHLTPATLRRRGLFNPAYVQRLLNEHDRGFADHGSLLFALLGVELWHRLFVDTSTPSAPSASAGMAR